jgi:hypothetical protein
MTQKEAHFYHCEDNTEGSKNGLGWGDAAKFLGKIRGLDGHIQRGEDKFPTFPLLSAGVHGLKVEVAGENVGAGRR